MDKYPWINFSLNLNLLPYTTWIQLGECFSKCEHIANIPLSPSISTEMHQVYLAKGVLATTAIEGNTLTEEQVRLIMENKLTLPPSREYLKQETDNILQLCNEIINNMSIGKQFLVSVEEISRFNKIILTNVPYQDYVIPGEFRKYPVGVGSYKAVDHNDIASLMERLCVWLNSSEFQINKNLPIINSIIKAIIAHLYIAWIHPFGDGNGRVARILEFAILLNSGIPSPAAHLLSNHYNLTRNEYYRQLDLASKQNDIFNFMSYAIQGFRDGLVEQLQYIFLHVFQISWENFVYETFKEYKHSESTTKRRRALVFELSRQTESMSIEKLKTTELYLGKSHMTILRDLNDLVKMGLIVKTDKGYRATMERMLAFLPRRINPV
jgi:Fic family protein